MMQQKRNVRPSHLALLARIFPAAAFAAAALLTGCGMTGGGTAGSTTSTASGSTIRLTGMVHGGQNPVSAARIQLYSVGTTATSAASTALIASTVTSSDGSGVANSNANAGNGNNTFSAGSFTITGDYSCSGATQVYLVATGGNPGSGTNSNLSMATALGSCATLLANANTTFVTVNELTTVAAAYALAPFATDLTHIGSANATALQNAFLNAQNLVNTSSGTTGGVTLPADAVLPVSELNTLGNILASCVNTTGSTSYGCSTLFSATGNATDTFGAGLYIAKHPGASAVTALAGLSLATAPFQPQSSATPKDFTVAVSYKANSTLATPYGLAVDANGNVWVTNESGSAVTELSPTGTLLANQTATNLYGAQGIAVDRSGNVWVANTAGNSVVKFTVASGAVVSTSSFTAGGILAPSAVALDSANNVFVANFNGNSVTELNNSGASQNGSPFTGSANNIKIPSSIAVSSTGSVYVTSTSAPAVKLSNTGAFTAVDTDNALQGPQFLALDPSTGNVAVTGFTTGSASVGALSEFASNGAASSVSPVSPGASSLGGVAGDGTSFWVANAAASGGILQYVYGSPTAASPSSGFGSLNAPAGVAIDSAGSIWTANSGNNTISQFIGLASPVITPMAAIAGP